MDTWNEIADWAASKKEWLETLLELPGGIPSHDTINRVFQMKAGFEKSATSCYESPSNLSCPR